MPAGRRVVITGIGAISSIGSGIDEIVGALREGRSGIVAMPEWAGMSSQIAGLPERLPACDWVPRRLLKAAPSAGRMGLAASFEAIHRADLSLDEVRGTRLAVLIGSGSGSSLSNWEACDSYRRRGTTRRVSPYAVPHVMGSTVSANVSVALGTRGESWSVSSACSTGAHAIGLGCLMIRHGYYERALVGASEEIDWCRSAAFDAMHSLSTSFNDRPEKASRPFDRERDGFVLSGGAGVLLIEELEAALARGAPILAEIVGFGASSDGHDMVVPRFEGAVEAMRKALDDAAIAPEQVDYVNAHGTSTPYGDVSEARAMAEVFGSRQPFISSTKSMTGHAIGAAGSLEAIYCVLMIRDGFLAANINLEAVDPACAHLKIVTSPTFEHSLDLCASNSFGFGGTNACLLLRRFE